jgi:hypothetical protein
MPLVVVFLEKQIRPGREKGVWRLLGSDCGNGVAVLGADAAQHVQDLAGLSDGLSDVAKRIRQRLEAASVLSNIHVALHDVPEFCLEVHSSVKLIIPELIMDCFPDQGRRRLRSTHDVAHILGDGDVKPADNTLVDDGLGGIAASKKQRHSS